MPFRPQCCRGEHGRSTCTIAKTDPDWEKKLILDIDFYQTVAACKGCDYQLTDNEIRHRFARSERLWEQGIKLEHRNYGLALSNFMKQVIDLYIAFGAIIIMILILLIDGMLSVEFENHPVNLLFSQPLNENRK